MNASTMVTVEQRGSVLVATMDDGKVNALSPRSMDELCAVIDRAEADDTIRALVIAGRPGLFSAGFDLSVAQSGDEDAIDEMSNAGGYLVSRVYGVGVPVVAACTGHALAAGALLLLGCDHRVGPDADVKIGLNEVAIGFPLPDWALAIAQERLSRRFLQPSVTNALLYDGNGAVDAGFLDVAVAADDVVENAITRAEQLAELNTTAYSNAVAALRGPTLARMAEATLGSESR